MPALRPGAYCALPSALEAPPLRPGSGVRARFTRRKEGEYMNASHPLRRRSRVAVAAGAAFAATATLVAVLLSAGGSSAAAGPVSVFPIAGARFAAPSTQITFRGIPASQFGAITVTGAKSGAH